MLVSSKNKARQKLLVMASGSLGLVAALMWDSHSPRAGNEDAGEGLCVSMTVFRSLAAQASRLQGWGCGAFTGVGKGLYFFF